MIWKPSEKTPLTALGVQAVFGVGFGHVGVHGVQFVVKGLVAHLSFPSSIRPSTRAV